MFLGLPMPFDPDNPPEGMPPQVIEYLRQQYTEHQRQEMFLEDRNNQMVRLWSELDPHQLYLVGQWVSLFAQDSSGKWAAKVEGIIETILSLKYNLCSACGENHEEMALQGLDPHAPGKPPKKEASPAETRPQSAQQPSGSYLQNSDGTLQFSSEQRNQMVEYDLDDAYDQETKRFLGFKCIRCGMMYVSIEDRMRREPGVAGCSGCIQKAKWG